MTARQLRNQWNALACTALAVLCLLAVAVIATALSNSRERAINRQVFHSHQVSDTLRDTLNHIEDAETGQRGFLLTGSPRYLTPFYQGRKLVAKDLNRLWLLTLGGAAQRRHTARLSALVDAKLAELQQTIDCRQSGRARFALRIVSSGRGQQIMEDIRAEISLMQTAQSQLLSSRTAASEAAARQTLLSVCGLLALVVALLGAAGLSVTSLTIRQMKSEARIRDYNTILEFQKGELERSNAKLEMLASTDGLTGLANHRAFLDRLTEEVGRAVRHDTPLSLVVLDVDHFKLYNDGYGHPAGDAVLKTIANILLSNARSCDLAARNGGEEFVLIVPQTDLEGVAQFAERLRAAVAGHSWPARAVTASFGVAALRLGDDGSLDLISRADRALYQSKAAGRNRVSGALETAFPPRLSPKALYRDSAH